MDAFRGSKVWQGESPLFQNGERTSLAWPCRVGSLGCICCWITADHRGCPLPRARDGVSREWREWPRCGELCLGVRFASCDAFLKCLAPGQVKASCFGGWRNVFHRCDGGEFS